MNPEDKIKEFAEASGLSIEEATTKFEELKGYLSSEGEGWFSSLTDKLKGFLE